MNHHSLLPAGALAGDGSWENTAHGRTFLNRHQGEILEENIEKSCKKLEKMTENKMNSKT